jgi:3-dehydrosphinganine reductase
MKELLYKNVVITGGSSGIGRALAKLLAKEGAHIALIARDQKKLSEAKKEVESFRKENTQIIDTFSADVSNFEEIDLVVKALQNSGRPPELLINSAGIFYGDYFEKIPLEIFEEVMKIDYFGTLYPIRAVLPGMLSRRRGHIVNISSAAGFMGVFGYGAYSPPKFAIHGLSQVLHQELKPLGIKVSVVFPPDTNTPQLKKELKTRLRETSAIVGGANVMTPEAVAQAIIRGIKSESLFILPGFIDKIAYLLSKTPIVRWLFDFEIARIPIKFRRRKKQH